MSYIYCSAQTNAPRANIPVSARVQLWIKVDSQQGVHSSDTYHFPARLDICDKHCSLFSAVGSVG